MKNGYRAKDHKDEIEVANQIRNQFGGKIVLLKEANVQGIKTPDYLWRGKLWELKSISTEKAADSALRTAIQQIKNNPGGAVMQCGREFDIRTLIEILDARAMRNLNFDFDVMALKLDGSLLFVRRYKK